MMILMRYSTTKYRLWLPLLVIVAVLVGTVGIVHAQIEEDRFEDLALSPDGQFLALAIGTEVCRGDPQYRNQFAVRIIDRITGEVVQTLVEQHCPVTSISWSPDGTQLVTASLDGIRIWNASTGTVIQHITEIAEGQQAAQIVSWSPDGQYLADVGRQSTILIIRDGSSGAVSRAVNVDRREPLVSVAWSNDSTRIATTVEGSVIRVWNALSWDIASTFDGHVGPVYTVAFSPDDTYLASGGADGTVRIWDLATGQAQILAGHTDYVNTVAWSPDGTRLASGSRDISVRVWDVASGETIDTLVTDGPVYDLAWLPDGAALIYGGFTADNTHSMVETASVVTPTPTPTPIPAAFQRLHVSAI